jgi:acetyl-CoA carboxylase alpha subunit
MTRAEKLAAQAEKRLDRWKQTLEETPIDWETSIERVTESELQAQRRNYRKNAEADLSAVLSRHPGGPRPS